MPPKPRKDVVRNGEIGIYHCWSRCVRRAYLFGQDPQTGKDFSYRRDILRKLMVYQAQIFAIDLGCYNILSNHFHLEARTRPDITNTWDDEEVAWRWKCAWPSWKEGNWGREPTDYDIQKLLNDKIKLAKAREGLSSLSWYMARIKEPIAKLFNKLDSVKGHFFESRFGCREILDESAVLCCSAYIDLNQITAGMVTSLEHSDCSSIQDRIIAARQREAAASLAEFEEENHELKRDDSVLNQHQLERMFADSYLAPIASKSPLILPSSVKTGERSAASDGQQEASAPTTGGEIVGRGNKMLTKEIHYKRIQDLRPRASDNLIFDMEFAQYRQLLEHLALQHLHSTGQLNEEPHLASDACKELSRLGVVSERFANAVLHFEQLFGSHVGRSESVDQVLERGQRKWTTGQNSCRDHFT